MTKFNKTLAGICASLFVITGVMALILFNVERKSFSSETFKQVFKEQGLYKSAPSLLAGALGTSDDPSGLLKVLNQDQMEIVITSLLPPDEVEALTNNIFDSTFDYINGKTDSITISLLPFKQNMVREAGVQAYQELLLTQPDCTADQILQMGLEIFSSSNNTLILCNPPKESMGLITPLIGSQLQLIALVLPDELNFVTAEQNGTARDFRPSLNKIRAVMRLSPILPLILLLALTLLRIRGLDEWLRWWGIPFIVMGALGAIIALIGAPIIRLLIDTMISQGNSDLPAAFLNVMRDMAGSVASQILKPAVIEGLIFLVIGSGMFGIDVYLRKRGYV